MPTSRAHVSTLNNCTEADCTMLLALECVGCKMRKEVGESGTPHIQGAVCWGEKRRCPLVEAMGRLGGRAHVEIMKGSWARQDCCLKDEDVLRADGHGPEPGTRNDVEGFAIATSEDATNGDLVDSHPREVAKHPNFISFVRQAKGCGPRVARLPSGSKRVGIWPWSSQANLRKTSHVTDKHPEVHEKSSNRWWDCHNNEDVVLVDDPEPAWAPSFWGKMKQWVQEKPFKAQMGVGLGAVNIRFKRIYVTCNQ